MKKLPIGIRKALRENNFQEHINHLKTIFADIPYQNYANSIIVKYENYYGSVVFVYLMALGYNVVIIKSKVNVEKANQLNKLKKKNTMKNI